MRKRSVLMGAMVFLLLVGKAAAQKSSGEILGLVTDPSGGVMSGVSVTITNTATNESRRASTDESGNYRFLLVLPGTYTLKTELASFKSATVDNLVVRVDEQRRQDITLQVGEVTQAITVEANPVTVNAESPTLGNVIEERTVLALPLNGRSFLALAYLSAGTVTPGISGTESVAVGLSGGRPGVAVSVTGMREGANDILFDGIPNKHNFYSAVGTQPALESIAEFKVQQGYFSPEYGLPAVVNVVTKSGTNEFHGSAWEFIRNDKLNARNAFDLGKGPTRENQYGVAAGGPIAKNKVFVFGSYEGQPIRRSATGNRAIVPTSAMLAGDFSALLPGTVIYDPLTYDPNTDTRTPFQGNIIPSGRITQFARTYIENGLIPPPTPVTEGPFNFIKTTRFTQDDKKFSIRGDWNASDSDKVFGRFSYSDSDQFREGVVPFNGREGPFRTRNAVLSWTHVFSPNLVNDARAGLDRAFLNTDTPEKAASTPDWPTALGLRNLNDNPLCNGAPSVSLQGLSDFGFTFQNCIITGNNNYHFVDNLAYTRGKHSLSFGGQFVRVQLRDIAGFTPTGSIQYTGQFSGNSVADFLLDAPFVASGGHTGTWYRFGVDWDFYVNDNFKLTRNFTLNYGLRYQYVSPLTDKYDLQGTLDFKTGKILRAGKDGQPRTVIQKDRNDLAPRFGFAWAPGGSQKWSIRSSYGVFFDRIPGNELLWTGLVPPTVSGQAFVSDQKVPTIDVSKLFPNLPDDPNSYNGVFLFNLSDRRSPYIQQWTLSLQRTLPGDLFVEAAYVGSKGTKLSKRVDSNVAPLPAQDDTRPLQERRPFPKYSFILDDRGFSNSSYNGLLLTLRKSYSHGLTFLTTYTWSKSLDNDSYDSKATRNYRLSDLDRGRSVHDIRQRAVFSMTYELPFARNLKGAGGQVLHGWEVNTIVSLQSGGPFHVNTGADPSDTGAIFNHYPNRTCDGNLPGERTRERWFDTSCFALPAFRTYGNAGVQYLDGPGYKTVDFSLNKSFRITEKTNLQFRSEFFNAFNFTNLGRPDAFFESPTFGQIFEAGASRVIQFGLKFNW